MNRLKRLGIYPTKTNTELRTTNPSATKINEMIELPIEISDGSQTLTIKSQFLVSDYLPFESLIGNNILERYLDKLDYRNRLQLQIITTMTDEQVKKFQQLQEERVRTFKKLDDDHKVFLGHAPDYEEGFDDYKKAVNNCTERFKEISKEIIAIKQSLMEDTNSNKLASLIGHVQELEETKLHTVVDLQLAR